MPGRWSVTYDKRASDADSIDDAIPLVNGLVVFFFGGMSQPSSASPLNCGAISSPSCSKHYSGATFAIQDRADAAFCRRLQFLQYSRTCSPPKRRDTSFRGKLTGGPVFD